ncbi:MAG: carbohydrate ABC transporter permease [Clostridiales bacterium]|nr:carbohydrate ABC transporter permease [Clostridiales bacterium]
MKTKQNETQLFRVNSHSKRKSDLKWHIIFIVVVILMLYPIVFAVSTSFKTLQEVYSNSFGVIPQNPTTAAYAGVLAKIPFLRITFNTFFVATLVTLFKLFTGILAAYSFVFFDYKGKKVVYFILICTIFIPFTVTMIPNFITVSQIGLKDNLLGVALPQMADATGIFLLRQHMRGIPRSLVEVAELENTPHLTRLRTIVIPMVKPAIFSIGIIFFVNSWNEYVWPLLILKSEKNYTLSLALQMFVSSEGGVDVPMAMATSVLTILLPLILYIFCQKFIIETFSQSGIKG